MKWWDKITWFKFFELWVLSQLFNSPPSHSSRGFLVPLCFLSLEWYHLHIWGCYYFPQKSWFQIVIHTAQHFSWCTLHKVGFLGGSVVKNPPSNVGETRDLFSINLSGRSPGEGNGNPLQYSCLENPMDRGVWQATFHGVAKESDTT